MSVVGDYGVGFSGSFGGGDTAYPMNYIFQKILDDGFPKNKLESSAVGYSQDLFDNAKQSVSDAQQTAKELAEAANVANKEFYDESWVKSEQAAENAYKRQVRWLEDYYPSLLKSIKAAGLNPNLVLSGGASVSAPSAAMASGDTLNMNKAQLVYDNLYMQLLREQMTDSNKVLTTSISSLSNLLSQAMKLL